ncbi:MAG: hypothetical protein CMH83_16870 [Nocardioides sp.]|nr:hypothetical protein [Nocardioides sp.]
MTDVPDVPALLLDDRGLVLPADLDPSETYDVLLNGHHVWSFDSERDTKQTDAGRRAAWPKALRRYLDGRAVVEVRTHGDDVVVARGQHAFAGNTDDEVSVTDRTGATLVLDKYGRLTRPLSAEGTEAIDEFLDEVEALLDDLTHAAGVPAFISYGTLLGAVRDGRLIGHDNDVDLAYVSELAHPVDVVRESYRVERVLTERGWVVRRGSGTRVNVRLTQADGTIRYIDVFTAHWVEGVLYMPSDTGFEVPRSTVLPLTTVELHGRPMAAPADSERLLALTYGEKWRTPDPSFKYETPTWLSRRLAGWFGGLRVDRKVWDAFYAKSAGSLPGRRTSFARWVDQRFVAAPTLVDLGSGTGRDAWWFATKRDRQVVAVDYALGVMLRDARKREDPRLTREVMNLNDYRHVVSLGRRLAERDEPVDLYGRFLLHALDEHGRDHVVRLASMALRRGGNLYLEFRTEDDRDLPHVFDRKERHYVDPDEVVAAIERAGGRVVRRREGTGLARFRGEDPHVCRIVARWAPGPAAKGGARRRRRTAAAAG